MNSEAIRKDGKFGSIAGIDTSTIQPLLNEAIRKDGKIVTDTGEIIVLEQYRWMGAFMSLFTYINFLFIFYYLFIWMREVHREGK